MSSSFFNHNRRVVPASGLPVDSSQATGLPTSQNRVPVRPVLRPHPGDVEGSTERRATIPLPPPPRLPSRQRTIFSRESTEVKQRALGEVINLRLRLTGSERENRRLTQENANFNTQLERANQEIADLTGQLRDAQEQIANFQTERVRLEAALDVQRNTPAVVQNRDRGDPPPGYDSVLMEISREADERFAEAIHEADVNQRAAHSSSNDHPRRSTQARSRRVQPLGAANNASRSCQIL